MSCPGPTREHIVDARNCRPRLTESLELVIGNRRCGDHGVKSCVSLNDSSQFRRAEKPRLRVRPPASPADETLLIPPRKPAHSPYEHVRLGGKTVPVGSSACKNSSLSDDPAHLRERSRRPFDVLDDVIHHNPIERLIGEWERLRIAPAARIAVPPADSMSLRAMTRTSIRLSIPIPVTPSA